MIKVAIVIILMMKYSGTVSNYFLMPFPSEKWHHNTEICNTTYNSGVNNGYNIIMCLRIWQHFEISALCSCYIYLFNIMTSLDRQVNSFKIETITG